KRRPLEARGRSLKPVRFTARWARGHLAQQPPRTGTWSLVGGQALALPRLCGETVIEDSLPALARISLDRTVSPLPISSASCVTHLPNSDPLPPFFGDSALKFYCPLL